jgi:hypothetical protein
MLRGQSIARACSSRCPALASASTEVCSKPDRQMSVGEYSCRREKISISDAPNGSVTRGDRHGPLVCMSATRATAGQCENGGEEQNSPAVAFHGIGSRPAIVAWVAAQDYYSPKGNGGHEADHVRRPIAFPFAAAKLMAATVAMDNRHTRRNTSWRRRRP